MGKGTDQDQEIYEIEDRKMGMGRDDRREKTMEKSKVVWIQVDKTRGVVTICRGRGGYTPPKPWILPYNPFFTGSIVVRSYHLTTWRRKVRLFSALVSEDVESFSRGNVTTYFL